ncbi:FHA domain-containing protein, partial [Oscillochloris sp. ZM17-4]|uniref:FHA domain-containing protein n=1 Tax=Oscillochloris sp. ZM17-4 TaxID=2866714 RepID=UPI002107432B
DEARTALAKAQADLAALTPPTQAIDPEALQLLEAEIGRQQQIIAQFEQMQTMFGAATPTAVVAGLDEARTALAKAQADLAALTGGVAPVAPATPATPVVPTPDPMATIPAPPPATPAPTPRLVVVDGGQILSLPTDKAEIIVGREDPVSNIFPEVDLTSFGGEAGGVSRQHAKITHSGGTWTISDLNSTNFTRVDGARLEPYVETPIHDGARIQFGRVVTTFMM